ncbi:hypothetical protein EKK58_06065 [Candidatus Dependentiae bacterium]|nr:MAG: hypothetical protein EKK58_06065 [Candidatus Dependentiae bacterium]
MDDIIKEGDMRGALHVYIKQEVPFFHAIQLLKSFDENLNTLYIETINDHCYKVEMCEDVIIVSKLKQPPENLIPSPY